LLNKVVISVFLRTKSIIASNNIKV